MGWERGEACPGDHANVSAVAEAIGGEAEWTEVVLGLYNKHPSRSLEAQSVDSARSVLDKMPPICG